jgi:hypothetical protein
MNTWRRWCQSSRASVAEKGQSAVPCCSRASSFMEWQDRLAAVDGFPMDLAADGLLLGDGLLAQADPVRQAQSRSSRRGGRRTGRSRVRTRRRCVCTGDLAGRSLVHADGEAFPGAARDRGSLPRGTRGRYARQNPQDQHAGPEEQGSSQVPHPGATGQRDDEPDHGENSYRGSGKLQGRRAVITGGDSGIGRAVAIALAREDADVLISQLRTRRTRRTPCG